MQLLKQGGILFAICFAGHILSTLIPIPIPTSVISMVLLFILFATKALKRDALDQMGDFLLDHMALFMIPASVSLIESIHLISNQLLAFIFICIVSTITTFFITAYTVKLVCAIQRRCKKHA